MELTITTEQYENILLNHYNLARRLRNEFRVRQFIIGGVKYFGLTKELVGLVNEVNNNFNLVASK